MFILVVYIEYLWFAEDAKCQGWPQREEEESAITTATTPFSKAQWTRHQAGWCHVRWWQCPIMLKHWRWRAVEPAPLKKKARTRPQLTDDEEDLMLEFYGKIHSSMTRRENNTTIVTLEIASGMIRQARWTAPGLSLKCGMISCVHDMENS